MKRVLSKRRHRRLEKEEGTKYLTKYKNNDFTKKRSRDNPINELLTSKKTSISPEYLHSELLQFRLYIKVRNLGLT